MRTSGTPAPCCCTPAAGQDKSNALSKIKKTSRSLPSLLTGILIAFFPKCPMCWAVYMSMFGSLGLAKLPYMPWLLPVLLGFLLLHLAMLLRKAVQRHYYLPFWASVAGAGVLLAARSFFPAERWLLLSGMVLVIAGSLLNNFSNSYRISFPHFKRSVQNQTQL